MAYGARRQAFMLAGLSACVTLLVALWPDLHFGYRAPALHVALETAAALVALLASFLVCGRVCRDRRLDDLLLAFGLAILAATNLGLQSVPAWFGDRNQSEFVWATVATRLLGAWLIAIAGFAPSRRVRGGSITPWGLAAAMAAATLLTAVLVGVEGSDLPRITNRAASAGLPYFGVPPALLSMQLASALLYAVGAVGFVRRFERTGDEYAHWLTLACVLASFSRVNYFLYPSIYTDWVYLGDAFRLLFFFVLLVGVLREISWYWGQVAEAAALDERRRIARDFHDGLAQELAFITRNLKALEATDNNAVRRLTCAAERAQEESRRAIRALSASSALSVDAMLAQTTSELADRLHVAVDLHVENVGDLSAARTEALVRIASEAIANAARHSGATNVQVRLGRAKNGCVLSVRDDGHGFDVLAQSNGYGLISMRERARAAGGEFRVASAPEKGTRVEVEFA